MLAVTVAYAVEMVEAVKKWSPLAALAAGMLAQDVLMRITRRGEELLDAAEEHIPGPEFSTLKQRQSESDDNHNQ